MGMALSFLFLGNRVRGALLVQYYKYTFYRIPSSDLLKVGGTALSSESNSWGKLSCRSRLSVEATPITGRYLSKVTGVNFDEG